MVDTYAPTRASTPLASATIWSMVLALAMGLSACGTDPHVLRVDTVGYAADDLRGLGEEQLDNLIDLTALALAVSRGGTDQLSEPIRDLRTATWRGQRLREEVILEASGIDEVELRARYTEAPEYELEVRHLVVLANPLESDDVHRAARAEAESALTRIQAGEDFAEIAGEVSDEPGAARRGGLLSPGRVGTWVQPFWAAALDLEPGEVSPVVGTEYGYHVIRLESRDTVPFHEARRRVVREVATELGGGDAWARWRLAELESLELRDPGEDVLNIDLLYQRRAVRPGPDGPPSELQASGAEVGGLAVTVAEMVRLVAALPGSEHRALSSSGEAREDLLRQVAEVLILDALAREAGINPAPADEAEFMRDMERDLLTWSAFLGFEDSLSETRVPEAALAALRSSNQNARVARSEIQDRQPLFRTAWPVERAEPQ